MESLSARQNLVLQCVIDAHNEKKRPYTAGVLRRMKEKGHEITERQCAYDLGVIINTDDTHVYSMKLGNNPKQWIYEPPKAEESNQ